MLISRSSPGSSRLGPGECTRIEQWHSWLALQEDRILLALLGALGDGDVPALTGLSPAMSLFSLASARFNSQSDRPIANWVLELINECRKPSYGSKREQAEELTRHLRTANLLAEIEVRSEDLLAAAPFLAEYERVLGKIKHDQQPTYGFRRLRVAYLMRTWLVLYFMGLRYDRLIDASLRLLAKVNALPAGGSSLVLFGREVERARHVMAMNLGHPGPVHVVTESPLLGPASLDVEDKRVKEDAGSYLAEFFYLLQLRLMCDVGEARGMPAVKYWAKGIGPTQLPAFRYRLEVLDKDAQLEGNSKKTPCGVYGPTSGIAIMDHAAFEWSNDGSDWAKPYSARYVGDREVEQIRNGLKQKAPGSAPTGPRVC